MIGKAKPPIRGTSLAGGRGKEKENTSPDCTHLSSKGQLTGGQAAALARLFTNEPGRFILTQIKLGLVVPFRSLSRAGARRIIQAMEAGNG